MATDAHAGSSASPMSGGLLGFLLDPLRQPRAAQPQPPQQQQYRQQQPQQPPQQQPQLPSHSCSNGLGSSSWEAAAVTSQMPTGSPHPLWQPQSPPPPPHSFPASITPSQQALQMACHCLQREHADAEACQAVRALAVSLGASRVESGTIKALHAVVLQLVRPGLSDTEAYKSTAASGSNFFKWRRLVRDAQLDHLCQSTRLPPA